MLLGHKNMATKDRLIENWKDETVDKKTIYSIGALLIILERVLDFSKLNLDLNDVKLSLKRMFVLGIAIEALDSLFLSPIDNIDFVGNVLENISGSTKLGDSSLEGAIVSLEDEIKEIVENEKLFNAFILSNDKNKVHLILCYSDEIRSLIQSMGNFLNLYEINRE